MTDAAARPLLIVTHSAMLGHTPAHIREVPERLAAAWRGIAAARGSGSLCEELAAQPASDQELETVHSPEHLEVLRTAFLRGRAEAGPEAPVTAGTWSAALHAAGAGPTAARRMRQDGAPRRAFCAVRPPGHHASQRTASGYCYLNNAMITACAIQSCGLARRVAILDIDHHHGNGTEALIGQHAQIAYASVHASGYPGTGHGDGTGPIFNRLLRRPDRAAWQQAVGELVAGLAAWGPEALVLSFGADALAGDPVGDLGLAHDDLAAAVALVVGTWPGLPLISLLEGGYHLEHLEEAVRRHVQVLAGASGR